ncbi:hypothetical protein INT45_005692 [Circinella minor]|uniref:Uncharacterized protein n=1 Tax=Circinella minor TaxID=1195481 RepID=A0A8H7S5N4_9FUNG|nr:hypothetical protein INT45_005692 [Circinella minor]
MDEDTADDTNNDDSRELFSSIDETRPSVSIHTTNKREPIVCGVPPMKELDGQLKRSVDLYQIVQEKSITDDAYSHILKFINECLTSKELAGKPILSKYKAETKITEQYPVKPVYYDYCQNSCQIYTDYVSIGCSCGQQRYKESNPNKLQAVSTMLYMPLAEQIAALISNDTRREKLMNLMERESEEDGVREDIFDGNVYKKQKSLFKGDMDIAISLYIDGFAPFNKGKTSMTTFNIILLNFSPKERYKNENMIQVCVLLVKPKSMDNFLEPLFIELRKLLTADLEVRCGAGVFRLNVHLMLTSGDIVAVQELIHHSYRALYGCQICPIKTVKALSPEGVSNGNYFSGLCNNVHQFRDIVHYIYGAPRIWEMVSGSFKNTTTMFELSNAARQVIGSSVETSTSTISSPIFEGDFRNYHTKPVPTIVCHMFELQLGTEQAEDGIDALAFLVTGWAIVLSWQITEDNIKRIKSRVNACNILRRQEASAHSSESTDEKFDDTLSNDIELQLRLVIQLFVTMLLFFHGGPVLQSGGRRFSTLMSFTNPQCTSECQPLHQARQLEANRIDCTITRKGYNLLFVEEKPPGTSKPLIKKDFRKCDQLRLTHIKHLEERVPPIFHRHLESLSINWSNYTAVLRGTRSIQYSSNKAHQAKLYCHYERDTWVIPSGLSLICRMNYALILVYLLVMHNLGSGTILNAKKLNGVGCPYGPYGIGHTGGKRYVVEADAITCHSGMLKMPMTTSIITENTTYRNYYVYS